jgi:hypothetical protein
MAKYTIEELIENPDLAISILNAAKEKHNNELRETLLHDTGSTGIDSLKRILVESYIKRREREANEMIAEMLNDLDRTIEKLTKIKEERT